MTKVGIISGSFDLLHFGHIEYLNEASKRFDFVVPIINTSQWVARWKQRKNYLNEELIKQGLLGAYPNFLFIGKNFHGPLNVSVSDTLSDIVSYLKEEAKADNDDITFFKMKDRGASSCPEEKTCEKLGIKFEHVTGRVAQHTNILYRNFSDRVLSAELKAWKSYKDENPSAL